jgi:uncharacterized short protein YbdD (DUF466 family)
MSEAASASPLRNRLAEFGRCVCQGARLMVGFPDYDTYVEHMKRTHPDRAVMTYPEFFRERQAARYGEGQQRLSLLLVQRVNPSKANKPLLVTIKQLLSAL